MWPHRGFICVSWLTQWCWAIFICLLANLLLWHVWSSLLLSFIYLPISLFGGVLFIIALLIFSTYAGYQNFVRYMFGEYFVVDWLANFCNNVSWFLKHLDEVRFINLSFKQCFVLFVTCLRKLPSARSWKFSPLFSFRSFIVLAYLFRSIIHLKIIFEYDVR